MVKDKIIKQVRVFDFKIKSRVMIHSWVLKNFFSGFNTTFVDSKGIHYKKQGKYFLTQMNKYQTDSIHSCQ